MADLKMSYQEMQAEITKLTALVDEFSTTVTSMTTSVNTLCDGWTSASTQAYREDYTSLTSNLNQTISVVTQIIKSTSDYIAAMQTVDNQFSSNKVTIG